MSNSDVGYEKVWMCPRCSYIMSESSYSSYRHDLECLCGCKLTEYNYCYVPKLKEEN
jgi:hypothetical protein